MEQIISSEMQCAQQIKCLKTWMAEENWNQKGPSVEPFAER